MVFLLLITKKEEDLLLVLVFVPSMEHKVDGEMLRALLPDLVAAATTRLRRRPRGGYGFPCRLVVEANAPEGEWLS